MKSIWGVVLTALAMTACQNGNAYKVDGVAEGLEEGDTILVINPETSMATDTLIVRKGKFSFEGSADTVVMNAIMAPKANVHVMYFTEPGDIHVTLSTTGPSKASGTKANDALQEMQLFQYDLEQEERAIMSSAFDNMDEAQRAALYEQYLALEEKMEQQVIELAKRHVDNEFGYALITKQLAYSDLLSTDELLALISQMPEAFQQRSGVLDILETTKQLFPTNEGDIIANFSMQTPEGENLSILDEVAKNRITVLDFWASWCGPCRGEMPFMKEMLGRWQDKGLGIVGISIDEDHEAWVNAVSELGLPWPQMGDSEAWNSLVARSFKVNAIPFTVVVDQKGTILAKKLRGEELEQFISKQLAD